MVDIRIEGDRVIFEVEGIDKMWALRSQLAIPVEHITGVSADDDAAKGWWHGVKLGGANFPGVLTAGTFYKEGRLVFYDVHKPEQTIVVELNHELYDKLVLQVRNPVDAVATIRGALLHRA